MEEFESIYGFECVNDEIKEHHDSNKSSQIKFFNNVISLKKAFEEFGNPFFDDSSDLISIGSNLIVDKENLENL